MEQENLVSFLTGGSRGVASMLAGSNHTLPYCLSKPISSLGAGKKQLKVWQDFVCNVAKMLLYPSFGVPLVHLRCHYCGVEDECYIRGCNEEVSRMTFTTTMGSLGSAIKIKRSCF